MSLSRSHLWSRWDRKAFNVSNRDTAITLNEVFYMPFVSVRVRKVPDVTCTTVAHVIIRESLPFVGIYKIAYNKIIRFIVIVVY